MLVLEGSFYNRYSDFISSCLSWNFSTKFASLIGRGSVFSKTGGSSLALFSYSRDVIFGCQLDNELLLSCPKKHSLLELLSQSGQY